MDLDTFLTILPLWAQAFGLTLAVEAPLYALAAWGRIPGWRAALAGSAGSCVTHPLLWFAWPLVVRDYTAYVVSGELLVVAIEAAIFQALTRVGWGRAALVALAANAGSYGVGVLWYWLG